MREALLNPRPMYLLLGYEENTCLVIIYRHEMDVREYLLEAFKQIYTTYSEIIPSQVDSVWPPKQHVDSIISVSGERKLYLLNPQASMVRRVVAFVGNPAYADPVGRLEWVVGHLDHPDLVTASIWDPMYQQSLSITPHVDIPITNQVLTFLTTCSVHYDRLLAQDIARFLMISEKAVEDTLELLNSVVSDSPLPFPLRVVVDFGPADLPPLNVEPQLWMEISLKYIHWTNHCLTEMPVTDGEYK